MALFFDPSARLSDLARWLRFWSAFGRSKRLQVPSQLLVLASLPIESTWNLGAFPEG